jgi:hypothetical protein
MLVQEVHTHVVTHGITEQCETYFIIKRRRLEMTITLPMQSLVKEVMIYQLAVERERGSPMYKMIKVLRCPTDNNVHTMLQFV